MKRKQGRAFYWLIPLIGVVVVAIVYLCVQAQPEEAEPAKPVLEFYQQREEAINGFAALLDRFAGEEPGVSIRQINIPSAQELLISRVQSGDVPDIFTDWPTQRSFWHTVESGVVMDLTDEPMLDAVSPRALEMARQPDGRIYALPINYNCIEVYYNQNLFERCGVAVPTTVDELTRLCGEFERQGVAPFLFYLRDSGRMAHVAQLILAVLVDDYREALQQLADGNPASKADVVSALRVMYELVQHGKVDAGDALTYYEACERFAAGESAMLISGSYALSMIESFEPADTLSVFPFPGYESDRRVMLTSIDTAVCVASGTEYRDEALRFVSFLAQPENAALYGALDQAPSCFQGVRQDHPITRIMQEHVNQYESAEWLKSRYSVETVSRFSDVVNTYLLTGDEAQLLSGLRAAFASGKGGENS